jgi:hypothetical protein
MDFFFVSFMRVVGSFSRDYYNEYNISQSGYVVMVSTVTAVSQKHPSRDS